MGMEMNAAHVICYKCGTAFSRRKGYFPISYAPLYKGIGYIPYCRECIEKMYSNYLEACGDEKNAVRQLCRKLDLYWNDKIYESVKLKSTSKTIVTKYLERLNLSGNVGKCYDDTLLDDGSLWSFADGVDLGTSQLSLEQGQEFDASLQQIESESPIVLGVPDEFEVTDDMIQFWGGGYTRSMYGELEQRLKYWMSRLPDGVDKDIGTEALIKQICSLELDINRDRIAGRSVEKSLNVLNTLLGSANLKPTQNKDVNDSLIENTPLGVWTWKYENERPLPDIDPELKDVDGIVKYILTWVFGHLGRMLNIKNAHSRLYDEAMDRLRVERPEYEEEDDDSLLYDVFGDNNDDIEESLKELIEDG